MFTNGKIYLNAIRRVPIWLLFISGLFYALSSHMLGKGGIGSYFVIPILVFLTGYTITNRMSNCILTAERCLCVIAIGCSIHVILNITTNIGIISRSETADFFSGQLSATNLGSLSTYILGLFPCLVITKRKKIKILGVIIFLLSIIYNLIIGTRSPIFAFVIMTIISAMIYIKKHYSGEIKLNVLVKWLGGGVILAGVVVSIYYTDFMNIRTDIEMSMLVKRYQSESDATGNSDLARSQLFKEGVDYLFNHPLGGNKINGDYYFHNYWLDVGRIAGLLPFLIVVIFDVILFSHMLKIFNDNTIDEDFRYALFGIYMCVFINFFVEPIMDGYLDLFYRFTIVNGMVEGIYDTFGKKKLVHR